jgi:hypothetical protein
MGWNSSAELLLLLFQPAGGRYMVQQRQAVDNMLEHMLQHELAL